MQKVPSNCRYRDRRPCPRSRLRWATVSTRPAQDQASDVPRTLAMFAAVIGSEKRSASSGFLARSSTSSSISASLFFQDLSSPHAGVEPGHPKKFGTMLFEDCLRILLVLRMRFRFLFKLSSKTQETRAHDLIIVSKTEPLEHPIKMKVLRVI